MRTHGNQCSGFDESRGTTTSTGLALRDEAMTACKGRFEAARLSVRTSAKVQDTPVFALR